MILESGAETPLPWRRGAWPRWAPQVLALWGVVYALAEIVLAATDITVAWSPHLTFTPASHLALAALALVAATAGRAAARPLTRRGRFLVAAALLITGPVFVMCMAQLPAYVVTLIAGDGVDSATGLLHILMNTIGVVPLVLVATALQRTWRGRCPRCGERHSSGRDDSFGYPGYDGPMTRPEPSIASKRSRTTAYLLMAGLLPWAGAKTIWTLGGSALGVTADAWRRAAEGDSTGVTRALASVGIDVTVAASGLAVFLMLGLLHPWGQVFPRWTLFLAGRRVPRMLPLLPAYMCAVGLPIYGVVLLVMAPLDAIGVLTPPKVTPPFTSQSGLLWMVAFGGSAFLGLGLSLVVAARSYAARTRPTCASTQSPHKEPSRAGAAR
ncbi:hypothetical protein [Catenulispora subtropica]|uniref:D-alanyl-D-alanine dipeptidase n=1 Tax=Catenulispora subtropica TaxID=450798 RepID=A0ABP5ETU7_9ACTN